MNTTRVNAVDSHPSNPDCALSLPSKFNEKPSDEKLIAGIVLDKTQDLFLSYIPTVTVLLEDCSQHFEMLGFSLRHTYELRRTFVS